MNERILVTGGAGFVGSTLALRLAGRGARVVVLDNLRRRGSELALPRLRAAGVSFVHGDVRVREDVEAAGAFDVLLECSAEPSVLAGLDGSPAYVVQTNLGGTVCCLEAARRHRAGIVFLSTSRVYPIRALRDLPLREDEDRFELDLGGAAQGTVPGLSERGIAEDFPLAGARSIYGATKLASELLVQEYAEAWDLPAVIDRCGVLAGPWQMGKVDQGVVMHWIASHAFGRPLRYLGFGGSGRQVRDVLHVDDLADLVELQLEALGSLRGDVFNVGGGREVSISLRELTVLAREATGQTVDVGADPETRPADVPLYLTDATRVRDRFGWRPERGVGRLVEDVGNWIREHRDALERSLAT